MEVRDVVLRKAWAWQRHGKPNAVLDEAYEIKHPANHATAALLHALLLCPELKLDKIAELMGLPVAVVVSYEGLFFHVRDRLDDKAYLARLVYPTSRLSDLFNAPEISAPAQQLLQAAYEYGSEEVLYMAGLVRKRERADIRNDYAELETAIVDNATTLARHGALNRKESPGLNHARTLLLAQKRVTPLMTPAGEAGDIPNIGTEMMVELQAVAPTEIRQMLEAQRAAEYAAAGLSVAEIPPLAPAA